MNENLKLIIRRDEHDSEMVKILQPVGNRFYTLCVTHEDNLSPSEISEAMCEDDSWEEIEVELVLKGIK